MGAFEDSGLSAKEYVKLLEKEASLISKNTSEYTKQIGKIEEMNRLHGTTSALVADVVVKTKEATDEQNKLWTFAERNFKAGTDAIKNYKEALSAKDPGTAMLALAQEAFDFLQKEADTRELIIEQINTTGAA